MQKLWENEKALYTQQEAKDRTDALSNHAQVMDMRAYLVSILEERSVEPIAQKFRRSHYSHGGVVYLCVTYEL